MKRQILMVTVLCVLCIWGPVARAGSIISWGSPDDGLQNIPIEAEGADFVAAAAGNAHSLALKSDGTVVAWGSNAFGQTDVPDSNDIVAIAAGDHFSIALREGGSLLAWGIEDGSANDHGEVTGLPGGNDFIAIAAGRYHGLALKNDGSIVGWGWNNYNQTATQTGNDFAALAGGGYHSVGIRSDDVAGTISTWGTTFWGLTSTPTGSDFIAAAAGHAHSLALRADGTLAAWGVQDGSGSDFGQVTDTPEGNGYVAITAGNYFNVALKSDGSLAAWGRDEKNQITGVPDGSDFVEIAAGGAHAIVLSEPGSLTLTSPNGGEVLKTGTMHTITWETAGNVIKVWIEYSTDNGAGWIPVGPANEGNTGSYEWLVPVATSQECLVRVRHSPISITTQGTDQSDAPLTIYVCPLSGDVTGDCVVDIADLAVIAIEWLQSHDPFAEPFSKVDFNHDDRVNETDLMIMGNYWLRPDCGVSGCEGTNVNGIGSVDLYDLAELGKYWRIG